VIVCSAEPVLQRYVPLPVAVSVVVGLAQVKIAELGEIVSDGAV
jgi:hypothetical protein